MTEQTPNAITIRRAVAEDMPQLGRLGALLVDVHHGFDRKRFFAASPDTPQMYGAFLQSQLREADAVIFVADDNGVVAGYAFATLEGYDYMSLRGPAGMLHDIIVDPAKRGRGIGRLLLDAILSYFSARGAPQVVLSTAERNVAAQRLFAKIGFRPTMIEMTRELDDRA